MPHRSFAALAVSESCAGPGPDEASAGGIRAVYFWHTGPGEIYMLTAYAKADRDDLSPADRRALMRVVTNIEEESKKE